jgi:hypothetical protein
MGHSRRLGFVRFSGYCGHKFLRQGRDGPQAEVRRAVARDDEAPAN